MHNLHLAFTALFPHSSVFASSECTIFSLLPEHGAPTDIDGVDTFRRHVNPTFWEWSKFSHGFIFTGDYPFLGTLLSLESKALMLFLVEFWTCAISHYVACVDNLTQTSLLIPGSLIIRYPVIGFHGIIATVVHIWTPCISLLIWYQASWFTLILNYFHSWLTGFSTIRTANVQYPIPRNSLGNGAKFLSASVTFVGLRTIS
ncbi:hypothetical protein L873DRAFT_1218117 [Choiromyces venosus 120613-1]|uniref:Wax synthase domain-containing protein n=1 Tax=Choiromyces venosus 120613-1 TaxID=1336337 RepID=A0A3N4JE85_9PEZI|nr:hypothetical protein L873DRAFT_1218117 [Choiromyces venosus 120613-1]